MSGKKGLTFDSVMTFSGEVGCHLLLVVKGLIIEISNIMNFSFFETQA